MEFPPTYNSCKLCRMIEELSYIALDTGKVLSARRTDVKVKMSNTKFDLIVSKPSSLETCCA